ncbi:hypothetical protein [Corynebacterium halotolerans]|uniref:hypothetical protein n=1 Tax=Corynebacterium halotolerans TaxID=225326 RepID=UPI003CED18ED
MSISWNRSLKTGLATAGAAVALSMVVPATASADIVDDALARIPAGQISCEQAKQYWTTESEYNSYRTQAQAAALFHPRGGEIRDALARIDEAANRCGLKGGGNTGGQQTGGTNTNGGTNSGVTDNGGRNTGGGTAVPTNNGPVFTIPTPSGTPTTAIPVADVATIVVPDVQQMIADARNGNPLAELATVSSR